MLQPRSFSEDWPGTTVHQIQGARITLSVSYNQKDWGAMQEWISSACSTWHSKADSASAAATPPVAEAAVSSTASSDAANPSTGTAAVSANAATAPSGVRATDPSPGAVLRLMEAANATSTLCADSGALQQVLPPHQQIQQPSHQVSGLQTSPQALHLSQQEQRLTHQ